MKEKGPLALGDLLSKVLANPTLQAGLARAQMVDEWAERVGPRIAAVSDVQSFSGGTLFVEVRSSAWLMELEMMKREILERLNRGRTQGPIDRIVFVQAQSPGRARTLTDSE